MTPTEPGTETLLAHRVEGEGEPVLLVNGGMMTYAAWEPVSSRLRERHRLILCDLRGQLLSPGQAPAELAGNVDDLVALLDHLEIDSTHVLGTSYGGEISLLLAALRPERVRSLIGVTVSDHVTESILVGSRDLQELVRGPLPAEAKCDLYDRLVEDVYSEAFQLARREELEARRKQVAHLPDRWFRDLGNILSAMEGLDFRPLAPTIRCPTLIVIAGLDRVIPPERSQALAAAIHGSELRLHPTSGHALVVEDPEWLAGVCLDFLDRHS